VKSSRASTHSAIGFVLVALLASLSPPLWGAPKVHLVRRTIIQVKFTPLTTSTVPGTDPLALSMVVEPDRAGETEFKVMWPEPDTVTTLKMRGAHGAPTHGRYQELTLEAEVHLPDGSKVRSSRPVQFEERTTTLFEVYRIDDQVLTLVAEIESFVETVVSRHITVGAPVRFHVEIQRVEAGRTVSLETDVLQTFVGEQVSYGFRLGSTPEADAVRLSLRPLRLTGELLEIEVESDGTLPSEDGLVVLARNEKWVASKGVVSTLAFESGEPPTGYRFLVTALF
jgi:hypothetical protein